MGSANKSKRRLMLIAVMLVLCVAAAVYITSLAKGRAEEARQAELEREQAEAEEAAAAAEEEQQAEEEAAITAASERIYSYRGSSDDEAFTMAAYDNAVEVGSAFIVIPFVVSGDGTLYVSDDDYAQDLTGTAGYFSGMSDGQIAELETRGGSKVVKLDDIFDKYGKSINYIIELEYTSERNIIALLDLIKKHEIEGNVAIASKYFSGLRTLDAEMPDVPKIFICSTDEEFGEALGLDQVDTISVSKDLMIDDYCRMAHERGKKFGAWKLNSEEDIRKAIDMGEIPGEAQKCHRSSA